jgi:hypothetical protein
MSLEVFKSAMFGTLGFIIGFLIGTVLDVIFYKVYYLIDPKEKNTIFLSIMFILQLYILLIILQLMTISPKQDRLYSYSLRMGLLASQVFLLEFAMNRLFGKLHPSRTTNKRRFIYTSIQAAEN